MMEALVDYSIKCVEEPHNQALHYASIVAPVIRDAAEQMDRAQQQRAAQRRHAAAAAVLQSD